jgi:hypothetical protein
LPALLEEKCHSKEKIVLALVIYVSFFFFIIFLADKNNKFMYFVEKNQFSAS